MVRVIGIDPGLRNTGWGVIEHKNGALNYIASGVIETDAKQDMADRLLFIHKGLNAVIKNFAPQMSAIEETYVNSNYASSLKLSQARGAAILSLSMEGLKPEEYPAKTIKKALVGTGKADKEQVVSMIGYLMPGVRIESKDAADAVAIAICHANFSALSSLG